MTEQQRKDWLAGRWVVLPQPGGRLWVVRRQEKGTVFEHRVFPTHTRAQKHADRLNNADTPPR